MANQNLSLSKLKEQCMDDGIKLISFDLFDTLLLRPCSVSDLRNYLSKKLGYVRSQYDQILADKNNVSIQKLKKKIKAQEENLDYLVLYKRQSTNELLNYLKNNGKKIAITTDIYYSEDYIRRLLKKNNIEYDFLFVSSKFKVSKKDGSLYKILKETIVAEGIRPEEVIHIGDNYNYDYISPLSEGIQSYCVPRALDVFKKTKLYGMMSAESFGDIIIKGFIGNELFDDPFSDYVGLTNGDFKNKSLIVSLFLLTYVQWMIRNCKLNKISKLLLNWRDGFFIEKILDILKPCCNFGFEYEKFQLNRHLRIYEQCSILPELICGVPFNNVSNIFKIAKDDEGISLCGDISDYHNRKKQEGLSNHVDCKKIKTCASILKEYVLGKIGDDVAIFDDGYHGSIADFIEHYYNKQVIEYQVVDKFSSFRIINDRSIVSSYFVSKSFGVDNYLRSYEPRSESINKEGDQYIFDSSAPAVLNIYTTIFQTYGLYYIKKFVAIFGELISDFYYSNSIFGNIMNSSEFSITSGSIDYDDLLKYIKNDDSSDICMLKALLIKNKKIKYTDYEKEMVYYAEKACELNEIWDYSSTEIKINCKGKLSEDAIAHCELKIKMKDSKYAGLLGNYLYKNEKKEEGLILMRQSLADSSFWLERYVDSLIGGDKKDVEEAFNICSKLLYLGSFNDTFKMYVCKSIAYLNKDICDINIDFTKLIDSIGDQKKKNNSIIYLSQANIYLDEFEDVYLSLFRAGHDEFALRAAKYLKKLNTHTSLVEASEIFDKISEKEKNRLPEYVDVLLMLADEDSYKKAFEICESGWQTSGPLGSRLANMYAKGIYIKKDINQAIMIMEHTVKIEPKRISELNKLKRLAL